MLNSYRENPLFLHIDYCKLNWSFSLISVNKRWPITSLLHHFSLHYLALTEMISQFTKQAHPIQKLAQVLSVLHCPHKSSVQYFNNTGNIWGPNPGRRKRLLSFPKRPGRLWGPVSLLFNEYGGSFQGLKWPEREVNHSISIYCRG